ncbi:signal peptidase I [Parabacteroides sp. FAFU027]|uniref:signal peptidase I n=1 Tax=Parabacteroides sp. FAFU027 TaxID=2922715 RepID=UPI001FAF5EE2|nr:signal peptidase I [Parabacteroides sp. FAFU027]
MKTELAHEELVGIADSLLQEGRTVSFTMAGYSMYPTLKPGDVGLVKKCAPEDLYTGDIIVFRTAQKLVAHRLVKIVEKKNTHFYIAKGDNNRHTDTPFREEALIGKVESFTRNGKKRRLDSLTVILQGLFSGYLPGLVLPVNRFRIRLGLLFIHYSTSFHTLRHNLRLVSTHSRKMIFINTLLALLQGIIPLGMIYCIKLLIDFLSKTTQSEGVNRQLLLLLALTAFLFMGNALLNGIKSYFSEKLNHSVSRWIYELLHSKHETLELSHYENPEEQNKMHRAIQQAGFRPVKLINESISVAKSLVAVLVMLGMFSMIRWYLILPLVLVVIPGVLVRLKTSARFYKLKQEQSAPEREMYYFNRVLTGFPFAKEMRLFGFAPFFRSRFNKVQEQLFDQKATLLRSELKLDFIAQISSAVMIFLMLGFVAYLKLHGEISLGIVVLFFFLFQRGFTVINDLFRSLTLMLEDNSYLDDFVSFVEMKDSGKDKKRRQIPLLERGIAVEQVSFRYETSHREALDNVSLTIPAGKTVAFVGGNGSGKTTMIKLLCGFYQPQSGRILYDDTDLSGQSPESVCHQVTAVFQDFALYNISAAENIGLGRLAFDFNPDKVTEAAQLAGVSDVLEHLPKGYNTMLGNLFEGGEELSIGQWQKMAIARAFYRDSPVLFMDEPSSALDVESEALILQKLKQLSRQKTVVIVSHRLSTVQWADIIYHFEEGRIVEAGSHAELMAMQGRYWQFVNKEFSE